MTANELARLTGGYIYVPVLVDDDGAGDGSRGGSVSSCS